MIDYTQVAQLYLICEKTDLRKVIGGLVQLIVGKYELDPYQDAPVSILWQSERPLQSSLLRYKWFFSPLQTIRRWKASVDNQNRVG